jgi:hypothetical protein
MRINLTNAPSFESRVLQASFKDMSASPRTANALSIAPRFTNEISRKSAFLINETSIPSIMTTLSFRYVQPTDMAVYSLFLANAFACRPALVAAVLTAGGLFRDAMALRLEPALVQRTVNRLDVITAYAISTVAAFWLIERTSAFFCEVRKSSPIVDME